ncbi:MAG: hypothetical protein U5K43_13645 [Halofilum sp. (in: g-proteobacteria)]|nr:hypothetical protein [Halofilum sp. (in: g-proteobacteria)]
MTRDEIERRSAEIARAMAISLNAPERGDLGPLVDAPGLHPTTRCRIAYLWQFRDAVRAGHRLDGLERRFVALMMEALESLLGLRAGSGAADHPARRATDPPRPAIGGIPGTVTAGFRGQ